MDQAPARNTRPFLKAMGLAVPVIVVIVVWAVTSEADPEVAGERADGLAVAPFLGGVAVGVWATLAPAASAFVALTEAEKEGLCLDDARSYLKVHTAKIH